MYSVPAAGTHLRKYSVPAVFWACAVNVPDPKISKSIQFRQFLSLFSACQDRGFNPRLSQTSKLKVGIRNHPAWDNEVWDICNSCRQYLDVVLFSSGMLRCSSLSLLLASIRIAYYVGATLAPEFQIISCNFSGNLILYWGVFSFKKHEVTTALE